MIESVPTASATVQRKVQPEMRELAERIAETVPEDGSLEPLTGLHLHRVSGPRGPLHRVYQPAFCVIAQGSKVLFLGDERYLYDPAHYLLVAADLPLVSHVLEASAERPYLSLRLDLEPALVSSVMVEAAQASQKSNVRAMNVSAIDAGLLDAVLRLVKLLDSPKDAPFLAPLVVREIVYRLLTGEQGERLRHIATSDGQTHRITRAIAQLRENFDRQLRMESVAEDLGMSVSSFHQHFKAVTAMSPLQFQKRLRLQEAKRLMLAEDLDAASAGYRVGYEDASHFSRDYKRLFGQPPLRDVAQFREAAGENAAAN